MAVTNTKVTRLTFSNAEGDTLSITLPNLHEDLVQSDVLAFRDSIVANNMLITPNGALTGVRDVKIITADNDDLD